MPTSLLSAPRVLEQPRLLKNDHVMILMHGLPDRSYSLFVGSHTDYLANVSVSPLESDRGVRLSGPAGQLFVPSDRTAAPMWYDALRPLYPECLDEEPFGIYDIQLSCDRAIVRKR